MIRSTWIGRVLCFLGLHRYEWRSRSALTPDGLVVLDQCRCRRIACPLSRRWLVVNREERRPW